MQILPKYGIWILKIVIVTLIVTICPALEVSASPEEHPPEYYLIPSTDQKIKKTDHESKHYQPKVETRKLTLEVKDKLINLQAENVYFKEILRELEKKTNIKINMFEGVQDEKVSLIVKSLPAYAIDTILNKMALKNFAVVYDQQLASIAVYILPEGKDISAVTKGKLVIKLGNFPTGENIDRIKGREIVSIAKGKNQIPIRYVRDEVLLKFHLNVSKSEIDEILRSYNLVEIVDDTLSKIGYVKVRIPDGRDVINVIKEMRKEHKLKFNEPNYILNTLIASDPLYDLQWYVSDTNFDKAWDRVKRKTSVKVAVIDSGVDGAHPDLKGKILNGYDFVNNDTDTSDDHGHGTFVAGIIAASANDIGIKGLYEHAQIIPVKVIDENGLGTYEDVSKGIIYASDNGAKVINLSIGGYGFSLMLQEAVDYALEKGCIIIAAGGNDGIEQEIYPAAYPDVIGVSALGYGGQIWSGSNRGRHIDVCAPGLNIISTGFYGNYIYATGTSASAPMVTALTAMLISEKPDLSSLFIERTITQSTKDLGEKGRDKIYGEGEIDSHAALEHEVEPFHDVAVRSVIVEPMVFEKGKPTYIVATLENTGTYESENCDVVLYEIIREEKKEIGRKKAITVIDKLKVIFNWKPERLKENIKFAVNIFPEKDENNSNNSKTTYSFSIQESDGLYVLYKNRPYVHSWIALQAYNILPSSNLKSEMTKSIRYGAETYPYNQNQLEPYDLLFGDSRIWEGEQYIVPSSIWSTDTKSGSSVLEGAWEEDEDHYDIDGLVSIIDKNSYFRHFWDPDVGYDWGIDTFGEFGRNHSALYQAQYWWNKAIAAYATNKSLAYYYLGRVVHLLGDMGVPEHVHNDLHPGSPDSPMANLILDKDDYSNYEEYTKIYYRKTTGSDSPKDIDALPLNLPNSYVPTNYDSKLAKLFYNMAQYTQHFDSSNTDSNYGNNNSSNGDGNNRGFGGGTINMGISAENGTKNQAYKAIAYLNEGNDRIDPGTTPTIYWRKYNFWCSSYTSTRIYEGPQ